MAPVPIYKIQKLTFRCTCGRCLDFIPFDYVGEQRSVACWACRRIHDFHRVKRGWVKQIGVLHESSVSLTHRFAAGLGKKFGVAFFVFQYYVGNDQAISVELAYQEDTGAARVRGGNMPEFATKAKSPEDAQDQWARFYEVGGGFHG